MMSAKRRAQYLGSSDLGRKILRDEGWKPGPNGSWRHAKFAAGEADGAAAGAMTTGGSLTVSGDADALAMLKTVAEKMGLTVEESTGEGNLDGEIPAPAGGGLVAPMSRKRADRSSMSANFSLQSGGVLAAGGLVHRVAPLFWRSGTYPFDREKGGAYSMTAEENRRACADFRPVPLDVEHIRTVFDGGLGRVVKVFPKTADYSELGLVAELPKWLDDLHRGKHIALSASWDRLTKRLKSVSLVRDPRIPDAQLLAHARRAS